MRVKQVMIRAIVALLLMYGTSDARELWLVEPDAVVRVDVAAIAVASAPWAESVHAIAPIRDGAWLLGNDSLVLLDSAFHERTRVALAEFALPADRALAAQPDDGSAWLAIGQRLLHVGTDGVVQAEQTLSEPVHALVVAGPEAIFAASARTLSRYDHAARLTQQVELATLAGNGATALIADPLGGYVWLARNGALVQFEAMFQLVARRSVAISTTHAMVLARESGALVVVSGNQVERFDREGNGLAPHAIASSPLVDLAGLERSDAPAMVWFADRLGFGALDALTGRVTRVPDSARVLRLAGAALRVAPFLEAITPLAGANRMAQLRASVRCDDDECDATPAYHRGLQLHASHAGRDAGELFQRQEERFPATWRFDLDSLGAMPPVDTWVTDAYGNRSPVVSIGPDATIASTAAVAKVAPTILISAPLNNAAFTAPATVGVKASATAPTGATVAKVEFYAGAMLLGTATTAPYAVTWTSVQVGSYALTARVTDSAGGTATSVPVNIGVNAGGRPVAAHAWLFNDAWASVAVVADAAGLRNGVPSGAATAVTAGASVPKPNTCKAVSFAGGVVDVAALTPAVAAGASNTVTFWMYWNGADGVVPIGWSSYALWLSGGSLGFGGPAGDVYGAASTGLANRWAHVAAQFVNGNIAASKLYIDGVLQPLSQRSGTPDNTKAVPGTTLAIGGLSGDTRFRYGGQIDEVRMYGRALTPVEVSAEFAAADPCGTPPTVALTAPATGASYIAPATLALAATAAPTQAGATIGKVEFYNGSTLLGASTTAPFAFNWTRVPVGTYSVKAKATDRFGSTAISAAASVTVKANQAPKVSITAPVTGASYLAPAMIDLAASASDADGSIASVEFYNGATRLATVTTPPYVYTWSNVAGGSYSVTARAKDDRGVVTTSSAVAIKVNKPPTVAITAPLNNATIVLPATVTVSASATDADGSVGKVEFFRDGVLVATDTASPYSYAWPAPPPGTYVLTARSTDNLGATTTSSPITIVIKNNQPPSVSLTAPPPGTSVLSGAPVTIAAVASDVDGTISKVEFYADEGAGGQLLAADTSAPYSIVHTLNAGINTLTAVAFDNKGAVAVSAPVTVDVKPNQAPTVRMTSPVADQLFVAPSKLPTLVLTADASDSDGRVAAVRFWVAGANDAGATLIATATSAPYTASWTAPGNDSYSIWAEATDDLGEVSGTDGRTVIVSATMPASPFSATITWPDPGLFSRGIRFLAPATVVVTAKHNADAGDVSKMELLADGVVVDTITSPNAANGAFALTWHGAGTGTHILTARLTDVLGRANTSAGIDVRVDSPQSSSVSVRLQTPIDGAAIANGSRIDVNAILADPAGESSRLDLQSDFQYLPAAGASSYSIDFNSLAYGPHRVSARAVAPGGAVLDEAAAWVLTAYTRAPVAVLTSPAAGATFATGSNPVVAVDAVAQDGAISRVDFYEGASVLATRSTPPYSFSYPFSSGTHTIRAYVATNVSSGAFTAPVTFAVSGTAAGTGVAITSPGEGQQALTGTAVRVTASVTDPTGVVSGVTFYESQRFIATVAAPPYTTTLTGLAPGPHTVLATASMRSGGFVGSAPVTFTVVGASAPQVSLYEPVANRTVAVGQPVLLAATASDADGSVAQVEFYAGPTLVATATRAPWAATWIPAVAGSYSLTAKARDNAGLEGASAPVPVTVTANAVPAVVLALPRDGQSFTAGTAVELVASAADSDGVVSRVDFYANSTLVASVGAKPYKATWQNAAAGAYALTAVAVDNAGAVTRSAVANVRVAALQLDITEPIDGATIPSDFVLLRGTINAPDNAGVTVNGRVAETDGTTFFVNSLPLLEGANQITVTLRTADGQSTSKTVSVTRMGRAPYQVVADASAGYIPWTASLSVKSRTTTPISRVEELHSGCGTVGLTGGDETIATATSTKAGICELHITLTDGAGAKYVQTVLLLADDLLRVDKVLRQSWAVFATGLANGSQPTAIQQMSETARLQFGPALDALAPFMDSIAPSWSTLSRGLLLGEVGEYGITRSAGGKETAFLIYFMRDGLGIWRLESL